MSDKTRPRKEARQERARATVKAILDATAIVLVKEGYTRATTNRIATVAGVNIASLYQYFPSKDALVAALIDRHYDAIMQRVSEEVDARSMNAVDLTRAMVASYFELFREAPELHAVLHTCMPRLRRSDALEATRRAVVTRISTLLDQFAGELRVADRELAAFMIVRLVESVAVGAFMLRPEDLRSGRVGAEAADLVVGYLFGTSRAASRM